jgi:hypothetical protein
MIMKKNLMLVLASVFIFNIAIIAQDQNPPQGRKGEKKEIRQGEILQVSPEKRAESMALKLGLTNNEKARVQALFEKQDAIRVKHMAEERKLREEHIAKFESERKVQDAELIKIIGTDNFQKLENERAERKANMQERRNDDQHHQFANRNQRKEYNRLETPPFSAQIRAEKMSKVLGLTSDEKSKIQALFEKQGVKREQRQAEIKKVREEQMAKAETERKIMNADLEKIIGAGKFQQLENNRSELKANLKDQRDGNKGRDWNNNKRSQADLPQITPEKRAESMAKILVLNEAQKGQVQALFEKQDAMRQQQIKKVEEMKEALRSQFAEQRKTNDEALLKIIGQEKFNKFQSMREQRQEKMKEKGDMHNNHPQKNNNENN